MVLELAQEKIWFDKWRYEEAEKCYYESETLLAKKGCKTLMEDVFDREAGRGLSDLASKIAKARQHIQSTLTSVPLTRCPEAVVSSDLINRVTKLEIEKKDLKNTVSSLEKSLIELTKRLSALECGNTTTAPPAPMTAQKTQVDQNDDDDDDDVDLFGSDEEEEDAEAARVREERLKAYAEKKSKKPGPIAKSSVLLDCKPWDDETDMKKMEEMIRKIEMDGLVWGASNLVPLAYGILKLSILCIVVDEKVSIDDLSEKICEFEDYVQSVDVAAFNKI